MYVLSVIQIFIRAGLLLAAFSLLTLRAQAAPGDVDLSSFDPGPPGTSIGPVQTIAVQPDGKVIMSGGGIARVNANGSRDISFVLVQDPNNGIGYISAMALQSDGRVLVGHTGGVARLNSDGSQDTTFIKPVITDHSGSRTGLRAIAVQADGKVLIGGEFRFINAQVRNSIARLNANGSLDQSFIPATIDDQFSGVFSIAVQSDGKVIIGGQRITTRADSVARLNPDGSRDDVNFFSVKPFEFVWSVALQPDGKIVIGGDFSGGIARLDADGSLDAGFNPGTGADRGVRSVALQADGKVLTGGSFTTINGTARDKIARLNADGTLDGTFNAGPGPHPVIIAFNVRPDGTVFVGGADLQNVNVSPYDLLTRLHANGSRDATFDTQGKGIDGYVLAHVLIPDGKVFISGSFGFVDATVRNGVARLNADGKLDHSFNAGPEILSPVAMARQPDGKLLAGGYATTDDFVGTVRGGIVRLNIDGTKDITFNPGTGVGTSAGAGVVHSIALQTDGKVIAVGQFGTFNGTACSGIVRLNADGSLDSTFDPDLLSFGNTIYAVAVQSDGKVLIGGEVNSAGGTYYGLARLNPDGSLDSTFNHVPHPTDVRRIFVGPDGKVFVSGYFFFVHGEPRPGFARLNANGSLDATFAPGGVFDPEEGSGIGVQAISAFASQPDGKVLVSGIYYLGNNHYLEGLFRLHADGGLDASFPTAYHRDQDVRSISLLPDGNLFVSGGNMTFNGVFRQSAARLYCDSIPPASFAAWIANYGLTGSAAAVDADPDNDGIPNIAEYILSRNPITSAAFETRPPLAMGGDMVFEFLRTDSSETPDITLTVESGINLVSWPTAFTIGPDTASSSPGVTITENGAAPDRVAVSISSARNNQMFARLKVTIGP